MRPVPSFSPDSSSRPIMIGVPPNRFAPGGFTPFQLFKREGLTAVTGKQIVFDGLKTYNNTKAAQYGTQAQKEEVQRTADDVSFFGD